MNVGRTRGRVCQGRGCEVKRRAAQRVDLLVAMTGHLSPVRPLASSGDLSGCVARGPHHPSEAIGLFRRLLRGVREGP